jgi:hypothetical protein
LMGGVLRGVDEVERGFRHPRAFFQSLYSFLLGAAWIGVVRLPGGVRCTALYNDALYNDALYNDLPSGGDDVDLCSGPMLWSTRIKHPGVLAGSFI